MARELTWAQTMDQRLLTDFRKPLWRPFMRAVREYDLIRPGDVKTTVEEALGDYEEARPGAKEKLTGALTVMTLAFIASEIRKDAEQMFEKLHG